ncbi:MAG: hypothetical protein ACI8P9_003236 [Parasphingorhabdus sp.]
MTTEKPTQSEQLVIESRRLFEQGQKGRAVRLLKTAVRLDPTNTAAHLDLARQLLSSGHHQAAVAALKRGGDLVEIAPRLCLANALRQCFRLIESEHILREILRQQPQHIGSTYALATLLRESNKPVQAIEAYQQVIQMCTDQQAEKIGKDGQALLLESEWWLANCFLKIRDYEQGWSQYEKRLAVSRIPSPTKWGKPWVGESLQNCRILLAYEQRFGDAIQFIRFAPLLKELGAEVLVEAPPELQRLFKFAKGVDRVVANPSQLIVGTNDYSIPLTSLPAMLGSGDNLLTDQLPGFELTDPEKNISTSGEQQKIGLIWAGKPQPDRSCPLHHLLPLLEIPGIALFSFQTGEQKKQPGGLRSAWIFTDLSEQFRDFYESAQLMRQMDLIITIDSAPAHLAGALGIPVWLLTRYDADWRWGVDQVYSDWYPSMRIFRQHMPGNWQGIGQRLAEALQ